MLAAMALVLASICDVLLARHAAAAWEIQADRATRSRLTRVSACFAFWGMFLLAALWAVAIPRPLSEQQAAATLVGIYLGFPTVIVALCAVYYSALLWRAKLVRVFWAVTATWALILVAGVTDDRWLSLVTLAYASIVTMLAAQGFVALWRSRPASGGPA